MNAVAALAAHMEAIIRKLDTLTHSVNMVRTPTLVCAGYVADHITTSCHLASTHMGQPEQVEATKLPNNYHSDWNKLTNPSWANNQGQNYQNKPLGFQ